MDKAISNNIVEVCKEYGIDYKSINPNYVNFTNDAQRLVQLYKDLQQIEAKLLEIAERNDIPELKTLMRLDVESLAKIDHDLVRFARKLKEKEC
jgi:L-2-hydroxyglutarate oxidase LhgO